MTGGMTGASVVLEGRWMGVYVRFFWATGGFGVPRVMCMTMMNTATTTRRTGTGMRMRRRMRMRRQMEEEEDEDRGNSRKFVALFVNSIPALFQSHQLAATGLERQRGL